MSTTTLVVLAALAARVSAFNRVIVHHPRDDFAAREIRRYTYLTTGALPSLLPCTDEDGLRCLDRATGSNIEILILAAPSSVLLQHPSFDGVQAEQLARLDPSANGHAVQSARLGPNPAKLIVGSGKFGCLYAAYTFAEALGVRFELSGEILPDPTAFGGLPLKLHGTSALPDIEVFAPSPVFDYRGLQPFHDFPEGPDWWTTQHYKQIITQLSKMKGNFIGLHTYPYKASTTPSTGTDEPTVWVGTVDGLNPDGSVKPEAAYPTSYANTLRSEWGYSSLATSNYSWGTSELFETDCWAPPPTDSESCPQASTPEAAAAFFDRTSAMLEAAFAHGNLLNVESCVGTETPLSFPKPSTPNVLPCTVSAGTCYQDATTRILPYTVAISDTTNTMEKCAYECWKQNYSVAGVEYGVACFCGDAPPPASKKIDPSRCGMACAGNSSEKCGGSYTMSVYQFVCNGPKPAPISSRQVYDGIFTRLKAKIPSLTWYWVWTPEGWEWGKMTSHDPTFTDAVNDLQTAMESRDTINPSLKMATNGWVVGPLPDRSIFDKTLPTSWDAITSIDLNTGHSPVDPAYLNITRHAKWAIPWMEDDPDLSAPQLWVNRTLEHMEDAKKYGCTGLLGIHWRTKETGPQIMAMLQKSWNPTLTSEAFWLDWASSSFGTNVAPAVAQIFSSVDSFDMPLVVGWSGGPGKMSPQCLDPKKFTFVSQLESLATQVSGEVNSARFGFWVAHFTYMRAIADTECAWVEFNKALAAAKTNPAAKATLLDARIKLINASTVMITALQSSFADVGTLGTYMNIESHSLNEAITSVEPELTSLLGPLPPAAMPPKVFGGVNASIVVPTLRTTLNSSEPFELRVLVLAPTSNPKCQVTLFTRPLGGTTFAPTMMNNVGRSVFEITANSLTSDFEYYLSANCGGSVGGVFPPGAPTITQSVVRMSV